MKQDLLGMEVAQDVDHFLCHIGALYGISDFVTGIAAATPQVWGLATGSDEVHVKLAVVALTTGKIEVSPCTSFTPGTVLVDYPFNQSRPKVDPLITFSRTPTAITGEVVRMTKPVPPNYALEANTSHALRPTAEFILAPNSFYIVRFTSDADANKAEFMASHYDPPAGGFKG